MENNTFIPSNMSYEQPEKCYQELYKEHGSSAVAKKNNCKRDNVESTAHMLAKNIISMYSKKISQHGKVALEIKISGQSYLIAFNANMRREQPDKKMKTTEKEIVNRQKNTIASIVSRVKRRLLHILRSDSVQDETEDWDIEMRFITTSDEIRHISKIAKKVKYNR